MDGDSPGSTTSVGFTTGSEEDTTQPTLVLVSPPDGMVGVPVNANVRVVFDEPVNPLTVDGATVLLTDGTTAAVPCTITFMNGDRVATLLPHQPLATSRRYTLTVDGVEDPAGNRVVSQTTEFTTSSEPDTRSPQATRFDPFNAATNVPVNTVVEVEFNEPLDPTSVNASTVKLFAGGSVPGTVSLSLDYRTIIFVSNAPLAVGSSHILLISDIQDLAGNFGSASLNFTTGFAEDLTPPQVVVSSPGDSIVDVPTNARIQIRFDEPIREQSADAIVLSTGGGLVDVLRTVSSDRRVATLVPRDPMEALTTHTVTIDAVEDIAGNPMTSSVVTTFTTGAGVDLISPTVTSTSPVNNETNVPVTAVVQVDFSERMNPITLNSQSIRLLVGGARVAGTLEVLNEGMTVQFTPNALLNPSTSYLLFLFDYQDLVGLGESFRTFRFTTAP